MAPTSSDWTYADLSDLLTQAEWQAADSVTLALLLQATNRTEVGWLDETAIAQIPCDALHQINHLWAEASGKQFGFAIQRQIYQESGFSALQFSQNVGWLVFEFPPLSFFKFYEFLNFSLDAPTGHLPALWYWKVPWTESWRTGGFGTGRGGGFASAPTLDAMMLRLGRCSLV